MTLSELGAELGKSDEEIKDALRASNKLAEFESLTKISDAGEVKLTAKAEIMARQALAGLFREKKQAGKSDPKSENTTKPKRKRRTKAEIEAAKIEAAKIKSAAATKNSQKTDSVTGPEVISQKPKSKPAVRPAKPRTTTRSSANTKKRPALDSNIKNVSVLVLRQFLLSFVCTPSNYSLTMEKLSLMSDAEVIETVDKDYIVICVNDKTIFISRDADIHII